MPTNLYGPNDNYDLETSHVLPALINKIHFAKKNNLKKVDVWGTGNPKREFLYVDDLADACVFIMEHDISDGLYNIGTQKDITIRELVDLISNIIGFNGYINFDKSMPDGTMRKILDVSKINNLGWSYKTNLMEGIKLTYKNYLKNN
jgi:GDP-L-fucose synthase